MLLAACSNEDEREVRVAAAANLQFALEDASEQFEEMCECRIALILGSSGALARQIREGLPADVYAAAAESYVQELSQDGLLESWTVQVFAIGRIALATPKGSTLELRDLADLDNAAVKRIAIANPAHAPFGIAAQEALEKAGVWQRLEDRLVLAENVAQAAQYVTNGDVDAGIISLAQAIELESEIQYQLIEESSHAPLRQTAAVVRGSDHSDLGRDFIGFLISDKGRLIMQRYGYSEPRKVVSP
jgi:molybdate transport system substrate-binding protein